MDGFYLEQYFEVSLIAIWNLICHVLCVARVNLLCAQWHMLYAFELLVLVGPVAIYRPPAAHSHLL